MSWFIHIKRAQSQVGEYYNNMHNIDIDRTLAQVMAFDTRVMNATQSVVVEQVRAFVSRLTLKKSIDLLFLP